LAKVAYENPNNNQLMMYAIIASTKPNNYISELGDLYRQAKFKLALEDIQSYDIHKAHKGILNYFELSKKHVFNVAYNEEVSEHAEKLHTIGVESAQDNVQQTHAEVDTLGATTPESDFIIINS
jgi:hypothetical protein